MSDCSSCCKCYEQADGSIVKVSQSEGVVYYTLQDLTVSATAPAGFITTNQVDCSKFDQASQPPKTIDVLEEVDDTGTQTGVLVQVKESADGTIDYFNLSDGSAYTLPAGYELHTAEDTDYNEQTVVFCDNGVTVTKTVIYKDGDITDVVSTTIVDSLGTAHTFSGSEFIGNCSDAIRVDQEPACFAVVPEDVTQPMIRGYIKYVNNMSVTPNATTTTWHQNSDDAELVKADHKVVKCC